MILQNLSKLELDSLKEIGNIGSGHATSSLSKMLGKKVTVNTPHADLVDISRAIDAVGGAETLVAAIYLRIVGDITGSLLILFHLKDALRLADFLLGRPSGQTKILDELGQSALKELGNICSGSYLIALSELMGTRFLNSVPGLATDLLQAVLDGVLIQSSGGADRVLMLQTQFGVGQDKVWGHLLFVPDVAGLKTILDTLKGHKKGES